MQNSTTDCNAQVRIRTAEPLDALSIYNIKRQAFGNTYLPYTIYQASQSVYYLEQLLAGRTSPTEHSFYVTEMNERVIGYYHAVHRKGESFLNYIAVENRFRSTGLGRILLNHYENLSRQKGHTCMSLDVFEDNTMAYNWYLAHGYVQRESSFHVRIDIAASANCGSPMLQYDSFAFRRALEEEKRWGFSKVDCECCDGQLTLGLIAGIACKLLDCAAISTQVAIQSISKHFYSQRKELILSRVPNIPNSARLISAHRAVRLVKSANQSSL